MKQARDPKVLRRVLRRSIARRKDGLKTMKLRVVGQARACGWAAIAAVAILSLTACNDTVSSKQAKARPPAATPAPVPEIAHESLPFPQHTVFLTSLTDTRPHI